VSTGISRFGNNHRKPPDIIRFSAQKVLAGACGLKKFSPKNIADFRNSGQKEDFSTGFCSQIIWQQR
jgi:hypothetical protein